MNSRKLLLLPAGGSVLFTLLYIIATSLYPGGSQKDANSVGFSWLDNYWCNLLSETAINGQPNAARPMASVAMVMLAFSLSLFWFLFPVSLSLGKSLNRLMQVSGILSMLMVFLLFTDSHHDAIINIASVLGIIALGCTYIGLYKNRRYGLFYFGLINLLLIASNNYCYYSNNFIKYLPAVQKITFAFFLAWIFFICTRLYKNSSVLAG